MPRVNVVKKARKDDQKYGIKKGDTYYWWKFRFGGIHKSKEYPKPQQLTRSEFQIALYDFEDRINGLPDDDGIVDEISSLVDDINSLADEQEEKLNNMPEGLQQGDTGQLLQERADALRDWASSIESIDTSVDEDTLKEEAKEEAGEGATNEQIEEAYQQRLTARYEEIKQEVSDIGGPGL